MSFDLQSVRDAVARHGRVARVVVADVAGSTPREVGAAMLVWPGGQSGTIGGGELEFRAASRALDGPFLDRIPLGPSLGQCCGGAVTLLCEIFDAKSVNRLKDQHIFARPLGTPDMPLAVKRCLQQARDRGSLPAPQTLQGWFLEPITAPKIPLWIYGAGHVGRALVNVITPLDQHVITWVDTGPDRFPETIPAGVIALPTPHPDRAVALAPDTAQHLILTYSHALDLALCQAILSRPFGGAGLIGSATKWARFQRRLAASGHTSAQISRIACPIGDPTLGKAPQAIAVGVAATLLKGAAETKTNRGTPLDGEQFDSGTGHGRRSADA